MWWRHTLPATWVLTAVTAWAVGCLPEAGPGIGDRRIAGRGLATLAAVPGPANQPPTLLFSQVGAVEPGGTDPGRRMRDLLVSRAGQEGGQLVLADYFWLRSLRFDSRGRVYAARWGRGTPDVPEGGDGTVIIDLDSGAKEHLGRSGPLEEMSPGGAQYIYGTGGSNTLVRTAADVVRELPGRLLRYDFLDEVLYGATGGRMARLFRARPDGSPIELLAENFTTHHLIPMAVGPPAFVLLSALGTCPRTEARLFQPDAPPTADPLGTVEHWGPNGVSIEQQRIVLREPATSVTQSAFRLVTLQPRVVQRFVVPTSAPPAGMRPPVPPGCPPQVPNLLEVRIRPGTEEIWVLGHGTLSIIQPDGQMQSLTGPFQAFEPIRPLVGQTLNPLAGGSVQRPQHTPFTSDGRLFAYRDIEGRLNLADVHAPGAPAQLQLSARTQSVGELPQAGTLIVWSLRDSEKTDVHLFDGHSLIRSHTILDVRQVLFGQRRLVILAHGLVKDQYAPGPLELIELPGGERRQIGWNVTEFIGLPTCPACDPTAPGAGVAYVAQARVPWEHDGLWTATLP